MVNASVIIEKPSIHSVDIALKKLRKKVEKSGLLDDFYAHSFHRKPSEKRREKHRRAKARIRNEKMKDKRSSRSNRSNRSNKDADDFFETIYNYRKAQSIRKSREARKSREGRKAREDREDIKRIK